MPLLCRVCGPNKESDYICMNCIGSDRTYKLTYRRLYSLPGYNNEAFELTEDFPINTPVIHAMLVLKDRIENLHQQSQAHEIDWEIRELEDRKRRYGELIEQVHQLKQQLQEMTMYKGIPDRIRALIDSVNKEIGNKIGGIR